MILRRVIDHVRTQNWTAVALDFVIVVMGVFMGIQLGNWNDNRISAREAVAARASLIADLRNDRDVYAVRRNFYLEVRAAAIRVADILDAELPEETAAQWQFIIDADNAGSIWPFAPSGQVYNELLNSGQLDLVGGPPVLRQMRDYYQDAAREAGVTFQYDSPFRIRSRRLLDWRLEEYEHDACAAIIGANPSEILAEDQVYFPPCPPPDDAGRVAEAAAMMHAAEELPGDARYLLKQLGLTLGFIDYLDDEAEALIMELEEQS
ncbi:MAG: hypothetical protein GC152_12595 [Alphaproteobacteria bacterium]|nr:hypothetical protein [Alphaproteobacteria bacterium]